MVEPWPPVSEQVVREVAKKTDTSPLELPPLYEYIDPSALNATIDGMERGEITFNYQEFEITVDNNGEITVHPHFTRGSIVHTE